GWLPVSALTGQRGASSGLRMTAVARVLARLAWYLASARKLSLPASPGSRPQTPSTIAAASPRNSRPKRAASSPRVVCILAPEQHWLLLAGLGAHRREHLVGNVDGIHGVDDAIAQNEVEISSLGDLVDGLLDGLLQGRELLFLALRHIGVVLIFL